MLNRILDFFVLPSSSDEESQLVAYWLRNVFLVAFVVLGVYTLYVLEAAYDLTTLIFLGVFLVIFVGLYQLLHSGYLRLASLLFYAAGFIGMIFASFRFGGVRSSSYNALIIVIIISALFLRGRVTILATIISIALGAYLLALELGHSYIPDPNFLTPLESWVSNVMVFILAATLLGITSQQVRVSLRRVTEEIKERQRVEDALMEKTRYQAALHETTLGIINRLETLPLLESMLARAEELAGTGHGYIDLMTPDGVNVQQVLGHGVFSDMNGVIIHPGEGLSGQVLETSETRMLDDYSAWPGRLHVHDDSQFRAVVAVPLISNEKIMGIIGLAHTDPQQKFTPTKLEILDQFAELAALAIENARLYQASQTELAERKRAQEALLHSEENLRLALDAANMGTWEWDIATGSVHWSKNAYGIFGTSPEEFELNLESYISRIIPADRKKLRQKIDYSLAHPDEGYVVEHRILVAGNTHWLEGKGKVYLDENGKPASMAGIVTDITERKYAEQALHKANQRLEKDTLVLRRRSALLQVAAQVSRAASAILDPDMLGQEVVRLVRNRFDLYYVGLFLVNEDGNSARLLAGTGRAGNEMLANNHQLEIGSTSMVGWSIANRQARVALDVGKDAVRFNNPLLPLTRSELALPLISRGQVLGALNVQSEEESAFSSEDVETFQTMADQVANAILNARLYNQLEEELEERKQAEEIVRMLNSELETRVRVRTIDLKASEEKFRALSENNPLQITRYDREGRCLYINRAGRNDLFNARDFGGKKLSAAFGTDPDLVEFAEGCIQQVFETAHPLQTEYARDDYFWLWSLAPEFGPNGEVISVITSTMDITERKRMEEELHARTQELQAANRELEAFSYSVSHDLRAPLRAIDGFSRILKQDYQEQLPPDASRFLQRISEASLHMGQLIDDILRLSRITRSELHTNQVDISSMVESILSELTSREPERRIQVEIQSGIIARGDDRLLRVALENLLSNAVKFTSKQPEALIRIGAERNGMEKVFYISDNGVGFDMAYSDKLFGAFQRLHTNEEFSGTGIGLAIVQRVIHKHGGRIWSMAEPGKGATFYFTL